MSVCGICPSVCSPEDTFMIKHDCGLECAFYKLSVCYRVVNIRAWLAEYSKITMTHGIQSKISVLGLSIIRGHSRSRSPHSSRGLLIVFCL